MNLDDYSHSQRKNGTYIFKHKGDTLYSTKRISILYGKSIHDEYEICHIIKHGTPANIHLHAEMKKNALMKIGTRTNMVVTDVLTTKGSN